MPGNRLSEKFLFLKDLQLVFYTKLKFQTEDQRNIRALPQNTLNFSECLLGFYGEWSLFLEAISDCFDWFFLACVALINTSIRLHKSLSMKNMVQKFAKFLPFSYRREFWKLNKKLEKSGDWKWWSFEWFMKPKLIGPKHIIIT